MEVPLPAVTFIYTAGYIIHRHLLLRATRMLFALPGSQPTDLTSILSVGLFGSLLTALVIADSTSVTHPIQMRFLTNINANHGQRVKVLNARNIAAT